MKKLTEGTEVQVLKLKEGSSVPDFYVGAKGYVMNMEDDKISVQFTDSTIHEFEDSELIEPEQVN